MTLTDRIESLRSRSQRVRDVGEWDAILADVRELEAAAVSVVENSHLHANGFTVVRKGDLRALSDALTKTKGQNNEQ